MKIRRGLAVGVVFGALLVHAAPADATAIAFNNIIASNFTLTPTTGSIVFDPLVTLFTFAQAQNSLGEADAQTDGSPSDPAVSSVSATWANGAGIAESAQLEAYSNASIPDALEGSAYGAAQAQWFRTFTVTCTGMCDPGTQVDFSVDLTTTAGLTVFTDYFGLLAETETTFNLLVDGEGLLFHNLMLSIGPNSAQSQSLTTTLTGSLNLLYGQEYSLLARLDSESTAFNAPEPGTISLLGLGLAGALRAARIRSRSTNRV